MTTPTATETRTTTTSELWNCQPMNFTTASPEFWMGRWQWRQQALRTRSDTADSWLPPGQSVAPSPCLTTLII